MNSSLIKIGKSEISGQKKETVNARELHQFLESKQEFANWIKNRIEKYGFLENEDYTVDKFINGQKDGKFKPIEYYITLDMAKELSMIENNTKGREIRKYFIDCEKKLKQSTKNSEIDELKNIITDLKSIVAYRSDPFENIIKIKMPDDSMQGTINKDDIVLCAPRKSIHSDGIYYFTINNVQYIRRLQILCRGYAIISDNKIYLTEIVDTDAINIIGYYVGRIYGGYLRNY
jgi:phage anti-repressor protein